MSDTTKAWLKAAGIRAVRTMAQAGIAMIGTAAVMQEVNWLIVVSSAAVSGILSLLTSLVSLPEATATAEATTTAIEEVATEATETVEEEAE